MSVALPAEVGLENTIGEQDEHAAPGRGMGREMMHGTRESGPEVRKLPALRDALDGGEPSIPIAGAQPTGMQRAGGGVELPKRDPVLLLKQMNRRQAAAVSRLGSFCFMLPEPSTRNRICRSAPRRLTMQAASRQMSNKDCRRIRKMKAERSRPASFDPEFYH